jgi:hypothetical protein
MERCHEGYDIPRLIEDRNYNGELFPWHCTLTGPDHHIAPPLRCARG